MNLLVNRRVVVAIVVGLGLWTAWHLTQDGGQKIVEKAPGTAPAKTPKADTADAKQNNTAGNPTDQKSQSGTPGALVTSEPTVPMAPAPHSAGHTPSASSSSRELTAEVRGTRRMYGAHAPLRSPEVADPDSATNRQILQTMVEKALSHKEAAR